MTLTPERVKELTKTDDHGKFENFDDLVETCLALYAKVGELEKEVERQNWALKGEIPPEEERAFYKKAYGTTGDTPPYIPSKTDGSI